MSWAEIKKSVNSNLSEPLNEKMTFKRFNDYQNIMSSSATSTDGSAFSFNFNEPSMIYRMSLSCFVSRSYYANTSGQYLRRSINLTIDGEKVIDNVSIGSMITNSSNNGRSVYVEFDLISDPYEMTYTSSGANRYLYVPEVKEMNATSNFFARNHTGTYDHYPVIKEWDGVPLSGNYDYNSRTNQNENEYHKIWVRDKKPILINNIEISISEVELLTGYDTSTYSMYLSYEPIDI